MRPIFLMILVCFVAGCAANTRKFRGGEFYVVQEVPGPPGWLSDPYLATAATYVTDSAAYGCTETEADCYSSQEDAQKALIQKARAHFADKTHAQEICVRRLFEAYDAETTRAGVTEQTRSIREWIETAEKSIHNIRIACNHTFHGRYRDHMQNEADRLVLYCEYPEADQREDKRLYRRSVESQIDRILNSMEHRINLVNRAPADQLGRELLLLRRNLEFLDLLDFSIVNSTLEIKGRQTYDQARTLVDDFSEKITIRIQTSSASSSLAVGRHIYPAIKGKVHFFIGRTGEEPRAFPLTQTKLLLLDGTIHATATTTHDGSFTFDQVLLPIAAGAHTFEITLAEWYQPEVKNDCGGPKRPGQRPAAHWAAMVTDKDVTPREIAAEAFKHLPQLVRLSLPTQLGDTVYFTGGLQKWYRSLKSLTGNPPGAPLVTIQVVGASNGAKDVRLVDNTGKLLWQRSLAEIAPEAQDECFECYQEVLEASAEVVAPRDYQKAADRVYSVYDRTTRRAPPTARRDLLLPATKLYLRGIALKETADYCGRAIDAVVDQHPSSLQSVLDAEQIKEYFALARDDQFHWTIPGVRSAASLALLRGELSLGLKLTITLLLRNHSEFDATNANDWRLLIQLVDRMLIERKFQQKAVNDAALQLHKYFYRISFAERNLFAQALARMDHMSKARQIYHELAKTAKSCDAWKNVASEARQVGIIVNARRGCPKS